MCVLGWGRGALRMCVHVWVGEGGTALQPDILGTVGWRCWPTCSLLSSAGSSRISAAASPHKAPLCNLPKAHKYNCNQERREEGGGKMDSEDRKRKRTVTVLLGVHYFYWQITLYLSKLMYCSRCSWSHALVAKKIPSHTNWLHHYI